MKSQYRHFPLPLLLIMLAAVTLGGAACAIVKTDIEEQVDALFSDNIREERETLRPLKPGPRVLVLAIDGVGREIMVDMLASGDAPHLAAALGNGVDPLAYSHAPDGVLSVLPSITMAAWTTTYTGVTPGESGVPGNEWYDRRQQRFYAPSPMSMVAKDDTLAMVNDGLLNEIVEVPTLFEQADRRSHASLVPLYRGVDIYTMPEGTAVLNNALTGLTGQVEREVFAEIDEESAEAAAEAMEHYGVPDLNVVYFPGIDLWTHVAPEATAAQRAYFREIVDPAIGEVLEEYEDADALRSTWIVVVSDHGHTPVAADDVHALEPSGEDEPMQVLVEAGFRVREPAVGPDDTPSHQAVFAYAGAMAYVYLADRSACPNEEDHCPWDRPPRHEEDVLAAARAFWEASATGEHVEAMKGTLDLVLARLPAGPEGESPGLGVFDGEALLPLGEYLEEHPRPELLELESRLADLTTGAAQHRVGDLILLARFDDAGPLEDRYYFSGPYTSNHGGPYASDSEITFVVARHGRSSDAVRAAVVDAVGERPSQRDVTPLILKLLETE